MKNDPIGIFDSGIGGLTIVKAIKKIMPNEDIIYFGDTEHLPYGEKSNEAIQNFSKKITAFLIKKKCKAIVIACNSASSVAFEFVKTEAQNTPAFNVIDPVIKKLCDSYKKNIIGVIGTKATIQSKIYQRKINRLCKECKVFSLATPLLAPMIEEGFINEKISNTIINNYLSNPKIQGIDHLILACTHYPLIQNTIIKYYNNTVNVVDTSKIVAKDISSSLITMNLSKKSAANKDQFYVSNYTKAFEKSAQFFLKKDLQLEQINLWT